jgi:hypothetical protein
MVSAHTEQASDTDEDLDLHAIRDRRNGSGRVPFREVDTYEGVVSDPVSLHKYMYANANPVMYTDPTGMWSLAGTLAVTGISALGISILLPSIRGAWNQAYHVTAAGQTQNIFTATFMGQSTLGDWKRVLSGLGNGAGAGAINALDTLTFRQITPLNDYRNQLWQAEGLDQSWVGTTANGFAWAGTGALYSAALVYAATASGAQTMSVSVRYTGQAPKYLHFEYGANGVWRQALGERGAMWIIGGSGQGIQLTGIPVLSAAAVLRDPTTAYNCMTAVMRAAFRGWGGW